MTTDTSERGLERLICTALTGSPCDPGGVDAGAADAVHEQPATYGAGWICGNPRTTTANTAWTWPSSRPSCARRNRTPPSCWGWRRTCLLYTSDAADE